MTSHEERMNPEHPESFNHRVEKLSTGRTYHFVDQFPNEYNPNLNATILCVHGFPDFWYGWRYQIGPWVRKGYRVVVPDMLGYGETDKPSNVEEYTTKALCGDLAALLDLINIQKAIFIGHDWGSYIAGRFALWYPGRLVALVMLSVAYVPPSPVYLSIKDVARKAPNRGYQVYFASQESTAEIEANLRQFFDLLFQSHTERIDITGEGVLKEVLSRPIPAGAQSVLSPQEMNRYVEIFDLAMNGPLNYYRTSKHRHEEEHVAGLPSTLRPDLPVLFMWGTKDATVTPTSVRKVATFIPRYQDIALENKGHWLMVEAKEEVTRYISEWLSGLRESAFAKL